MHWLAVIVGGHSALLVLHIYWTKCFSAEGVFDKKVSFFFISPIVSMNLSYMIDLTNISIYRLFSDDAAALVKYNNIESDLTKSNNEERSFGINSRSINSNNIGQKCSALKEAAADITTIEEYQKFDFQPNWMKNKEYWDATFEERYEKHMKNEKRPPLKVFL